MKRRRAGVCTIIAAAIVVSCGSGAVPAAGTAGDTTATATVSDIDGWAQRNADSLSEYVQAWDTDLRMMDYHLANDRPDDRHAVCGFGLADAERAAAIDEPLAAGAPNSWAALVAALDVLFLACTLDDFAQVDEQRPSIPGQVEVLLSQIMPGTASELRNNLSVLAQRATP